MSEEMTLSEALNIYFSQAESSREGWCDVDDETWERAEESINKHRKEIFNSLKLQELVKKRMNATYIPGHKKLSDEVGYLEQELRSLVEESERITSGGFGKESQL